MKKLINLKIDLSKIDKNELFKSEKTGSIYLDAVILFNEDKDQYGNNGPVIQSISEEKRKDGNRGAILGNVRIFESKSAQIEDDDLPF